MSNKKLTSKTPMHQLYNELAKKYPPKTWVVLDESGIVESGPNSNELSSLQQPEDPKNEKVCVYIYPDVFI